MYGVGGSDWRPCCFIPWREFPVSFEWEIERVPGPVWILSAGNRTPLFDCPARSLLRIPTELFWLQSYYRTCFDLPFLLSSFSRLQQNSLMQNAAEDLYRTEERTVLIVTNLWYRSDVWLEVSRHPGQRVASHTTSLNQVLVHLSADSAAPWCDRIHCHVSKL